MYACLLGVELFTGCSKDKEEAKERKWITIKVSELGNFSERGQDYNERVTYCGMPNKETFSLSTNTTAIRVNYYFPKDSKIIKLHNQYYEILSVNPNQVTLKKIR